MKNNLLVVGGTGFIGSRITEEALNQGYNVTVISKGHVPSEKKQNMLHIFQLILQIKMIY